MVLAFIELGCTTAVDTWRHGPSHGSQTLRNGNGGRLTVYVLEYGPTPVRQKGQCRTGVILGAPHSPGRRPPSARSVKRSTRGSRQPSAGARRYPFDRLRSGPGARLARTQSPATARHSLGVLRRVFDYAVQDGAIPRNSATGIRLPRAQGNEPQPLTHTELWQLAEQFASRRDRVLIVVAGYCGLRWGELAALRWTDIDLDMRRLRVSRAYSEEAPRGEMSPVKDHQARTLPIPRTVVDELADLQAQSAPSELVFPSANCTPLRNRNFRRDSFDAATAALGLTITPHNLRDTAASLAIQAGASVVAVARLLGHESAATTLNHYAGLFPTDLDDVAIRLDVAARQPIGDQ